MAHWSSSVDVVDSHVHAIDRNKMKYNVVEFKTDPSLAKDWSEDMYRTATKSIPVKKAVFLEVNAAEESMVDEVAWVHGLMKQPNSVFGAIVANAPVEKGAKVTNSFLDKYEAMGAKVVGVRRLIQDLPAGSCVAKEFVDGVAALAKRQMHFELCIRAGAVPQQCKEVLQLISSVRKQVPGAVFVLDHMGKPGIKAQELSPWKEFITDLAALPNTYCKISGALTEADVQAWTTEDLAPFVLHALHSFGYDRCCFGSDWFVVTMATAGAWKDASPAEAWYQSLCAILDQDKATDDNKADLFARVATKLYHLK